MLSAYLTSLSRHACGLLVRLRRLGDSGWTQGNAEADAKAADRRVVPEPARRPTIRGLAAPTAATEHAERALFWASRIADCTFGIISGPALQDILEKYVRVLGAIRLIDSRIGVPGQLACNPRVILGCFRTTIGFACLHILVLFVILRLHCIHSDIHRTSGSLGCNFCCTHDIDATGLAGVASNRHHRWLGILDFASRTGHRAVVC